jgi:hypothetical protein
MRVCLLLWGCLHGIGAHGYGGGDHQDLTFAAARLFNACAEQRGVNLVTALQVRYLVRATREEASAGYFGRLLRWPYYDPADGGDRRLLWVAETRLTERFAKAVRDLERARDANARYSALGVVVAYLQEVTVPAAAVPVYHDRFWRGSLGDHFEDYPLQLEALDHEVDALCDALFADAAPATHAGVLADTAERTRRAVRASIPGLEATWQAFWREDPAGGFGEFGPAGNAFGEAVRFVCGISDCELAERDPLYTAFAAARHRDAVLATMRALLIVQRAVPLPGGDGDGAAKGSGLPPAP